MFSHLSWKIQPLTWQTVLSKQQETLFKNYQLLGVDYGFKIILTYMYSSKCSGLGIPKLQKI